MSKADMGNDKKLPLFEEKKSDKQKIKEKEKLKELRLKIKRENYNLFKELTDKQAGELIKGMCAYMYDCKPFFTKDAYLKGAFMGIKKEIDEAKQNSLNGKKSAEAYAERQRRKQAMGEIGAIIGGMLSAAEVMDKDTNDGK